MASLLLFQVRKDIKTETFSPRSVYICFHRTIFIIQMPSNLNGFISRILCLLDDRFHLQR